MTNLIYACDSESNHNLNASHQIYHISYFMRAWILLFRRLKKLSVVIHFHKRCSDYLCHANNEITLFDFDQMRRKKKKLRMYLKHSISSRSVWMLLLNYLHAIPPLHEFHGIKYRRRSANCPVVMQVALRSALPRSVIAHVFWDSLCARRRWSCIGCVPLITPTCFEYNIVNRYVFL